jgi:uncharacterized membrane-anchored protein
MEETDRREPDKLHALLAAGFSASDPDTRLAYFREWKYTLEEMQRQTREREAETRLKEAKAQRQESEARAREAEAKLAAVEREKQLKKQQAACRFLADGVPPEVVARNFGIPLADVLKLATA